MRRRDLLSGLLGLAGLPVIGAAGARAIASAHASAPVVSEKTPALPFWGINTDIKYNVGDDAYRRTVIALARELGMGYVREAVLNMGGTEDGAAFDWRWLDQAVGELEDAGLGLALALHIGECANPDNFGPAWERNVAWRVHGAARHFGKRVLWYTPWNEPDLDGVEDATVLRAQEIVYRELKEADPSLLVESAPLASPPGEGGMMYRLCEGGITRHCDFLGCHLHNGVHDDSRYSFAHAWRAQRHGQAAGHPVRPVSLSENGYGLNRVRHPQPLKLKAHWAMLNLVQVKRYGFAQALVFTLATPKPRAEPFALVDMHAGFAKRQPAFDVYRAAYNSEAWSLQRGCNGGFEEAQADKTAGWVVHYNPLAPGGGSELFPEWERVAFRTDGAASRSGRGYCRMAPGGANKVRRLVEGLTPGRPYTLSGWVRLEGAGAAASLGALGHNRLDGLDDRTATTGETGDWTELRVTFTPSNPWVVIGLDHNGQGIACWDDVALA